MTITRYETQLIQGRLLKKCYEDDILINVHLFDNYFNRDCKEFIEIANAGKISESDWKALESFIKELVLTVDLLTIKPDPVIEEYSKTELIQKMDRIHKATLKLFSALYEGVATSFIQDFPMILIDEKKLRSLPLTKLSDFSEIWKSYYQEDLDPWDSCSNIVNEPLADFEKFQYFLYFLEKKSSLLKAIIKNELYYDISPYTNIKINKKENKGTDKAISKDMIYSSYIISFWEDHLGRTIKIVNRTTPTNLTKFSQKIFFYILKKNLTIETIEEKLKIGKKIHNKNSKYSGYL